MAVTATPSPTANSYASNAFAVALWQSDPHKATDFPSVESDQDTALISATNMLNDFYQESWKGTITDATNALYWPRDDVEDPRTGEDYATDDYPDILKRATAILAYYIFKSDRNSETSVAQAQGPVVRERLGDKEIEYAEPSGVRVKSISTIPTEVARIISPLVEGGVTASGFGATVLGRG